MMSLQWHRVLSIAFATLTLLSLAPRDATALSNPNDFCTGNPCIISSNKTIDNLAVVDFGTRAVIVQAELSVGTGSATVRAGSFSVPQPGRLRGLGTTAVAGGSLTVQTTGDITIDSLFSLGAARFNGQSGGGLNLISSAGSVRGQGNFFMENTVDAGYGGALFVSAAGEINLTGDISARGGLMGDGGSLDAFAGGDVRLTGFININGGGGGAGFMTVSAGGLVTLGPIDADGRAEGSEGGYLDVSAIGPVTFGGRVNARGGQNIGFCGDGGTIEVVTDGNISINAAVKLNGEIPDCCGGTLTLEGNDVTVGGVTELIGLGEFGCGGIAEIFATGDITVNQKMTLNGGDGGSGDLLFSAEGNIDILAPIENYSRNQYGFGSAATEFESLGGTVRITNLVDVSGGALGFGGDLQVYACGITVEPGGNLRAGADFGLIGLTASDSMTLRGQFFAGPNNAAIEVVYGTRAAPPNIGSATFNIPPSLTLDPFLPPCVLCLSNAECADGNLCTDDVCVPATGCSNPPNTAPCTDGNGCTLGDVCGGGSCTPGAPRNCADGNTCTQDLCNPANGLCQNPAVPAGTGCNDANNCTQTDQCNASGTCVGSNPVVCPPGGQCENPGTCSPATGVCSAPVPKPSGAVCNDGNACSLNDRCNGAGACAGTSSVVCVPQSQCHDAGVCNPGTGICSNPPKATGAPCDDDDVCTSPDACNSGSCTGPLVSGCIDADGDGVPDDQDQCVALDWNSPPGSPPDQNPVGFSLGLQGLSAAAGEQIVVVKGYFNLATSLLPVDPAANGTHLYIEQLGGFPTPSGGRAYEVNIPGGLVGSSPCDARDGWKRIVRPTKTIWKYVNRSGALPPACVPGSAKGVTSLQVKDMRLLSKAAYQLIVRARNTALDLTPRIPITRVRTSLALGAQPAPGVASEQAEAGQCTESVFEGTPVRSGLPRPFCKPVVRNGTLATITCKGL